MKVYVLVLLDVNVGVFFGKDDAIAHENKLKKQNKKYMEGMFQIEEHVVDSPDRMGA